MNSFNSWSPRRTIVISTLGAAGVTLAFFCPRFWLWPAAGMPLNEFVAIQPEFHRAFHVLRQLQDPWQRIDDPVNRVIEWRLFWPVLAHTLNFPRGLYLGVPALGCLAALTATALFTWRATHAALATMATTFLVATSSWFFVSTGWLGYFDSWLIVALLLASFASSRWALLAAALVAPWIDERFILALPVCIAVRSLGADRATPPDRRAWTRDALVLAAGIVPYIAVRLGAEVFGMRATSESYWAGRPLLPAPVLAIVWGAWNGLRLGWILVGLAAAAAFRFRRHRVAVAIVLGTVLIHLLVADDLSRSASVAIPALVAATMLVWRNASASVQRALPFLCLGNLVVPAQHVIAAPGTAAEYHCVPILAADAELERRRNPPDFAHAATYTRRSMDHLQAGNTERALVAADIALRFDPSSARARANRGIILHVAGRPAEGMAELDRALQDAPELYDARMQRAAFRQQAGNLRGALDDVRAALQHMPIDWPRRTEAQQFEKALAAQAGR